MQEDATTCCNNLPYNALRASAAAPAPLLAPAPCPNTKSSRALRHLNSTTTTRLRLGQTRARSTAPCRTHAFVSRSAPEKPSLGALATFATGGSLTLAGRAFWLLPPLYGASGVSRALTLRYTHMGLASATRSKRVRITTRRLRTEPYQKHVFIWFAAARTHWAHTQSVRLACMR